MKKAIVYIILISLTADVYSQQIIPGSQLTSTDYLKKSKRQKTAASTLGTAGAVLATAGLVWSLSKTFEDTPGDELSVGGLAAVAASIPLFIASKRNYRKAGNLSSAFIIQQTTLTSLNGFSYRPYAALSVRLTFKATRIQRLLKVNMPLRSS